MDKSRLIEHAFPLKQASLDSVHEKNVRHGHISTLHIWPARRPLAACRAALIATLLPDPGTPEARQKLCEKIGGKVVKKIERKKMPGGRVVEREKEATEGGILHWGRETENKELLEWFRQEIRKAYGGRPPKVLDPFAGGGAIPLEAMRLGCEVTAVDINPVAWFILKCTLEYPQKLAGKTHPLPDFILENEEFMKAFYKAHPRCRSDVLSLFKQAMQRDVASPLEADLAWHVRAWGQWVLDRARRELARFYPTYAEFEPVEVASRRFLCDGTSRLPYEKQPTRLVPLKEDGKPDIDRLNAQFSAEYLADKRNPRWVAKPTVAYLWARTVTCKNCRATIPLLKTRWLCKKEKKRVLLTMQVIVDAASSPRARSVETALLHYFDPEAPIGNLSGNLPHWRQDGATYFVTFRLADSMPQEKLLQWEEERKAWQEKHPEPHDEKTRREYYQLFPQRFQEWLDAGYGECILAKPEIKALVESALRHFDGERYLLDEHVVMPNHVHALVTPLAGHELSEILHSWKSYTAHEINRKLGRSGTVWQKESFDHIIRSPAQMERVRQYIRNNPKGKPEDSAAPTRRDVASTVVFGIETNVPVKGGNAAQRREHDKRLGAGTMSRSGAKCPCCGTIMTMEDIRLEGRAGRLGSVMTAVVVEGQDGKEYRLPEREEIEKAGQAEKALPDLFAQIPFGLPVEPTPRGGIGASRAFSVDGYGFTRWRDLFTPRQLLALGTFVKWTREAATEMLRFGYPSEWREAVIGYLAILNDKVADYNSTTCRWVISGEFVGNTFTRFALPITWDFAEVAVINVVGAAYCAQLNWVSLCIDHALLASTDAEAPVAENRSALEISSGQYDAVVTDPPYYDAIPYSDLMDFFYLWLKRSLNGLSLDLDRAFRDPLSPKWNHERNDGELIDDASRHGGDKAKSKAVYEEGMARAFQACRNALKPDGKMVVVFANKQPDAWEALVSALVRSGFVVDGSWPIQTEMNTRMRAKASSALASSVWLVCKKRVDATSHRVISSGEDAASTFVDATSRRVDESGGTPLLLSKPGWDNQVLEEMRRNIRAKLREFWDAGIRGPDFVWAATGPALEAYSKHPVVKKANEPGLMTVSEFLAHVRRMVVEFVVGRVLSGSEHEDTRRDDASTLDDPTAYYLLHRHDFGLEEAPAGACILYAISCGLSDKELADTWDIIGYSRSDVSSLEDDDEIEEEESGEDAATTFEESGSKVKLKTWAQRKRRSLGYEAPAGKPIPLIDRVHRLMHLWKAGDLAKVDEYLDGNGLRRQELFKRLLQSLIELSPHGSEERSLLESLSNHVQARGAVKENRQLGLTFGDDTDTPSNKEDRP
ncbi:MAG: DUF1156 domain-containing protein [bacterium]